MQPPPPPEPAAGRRASSSSSSTCSTAAPRRSTTVGCMAGLLRLFSPYHRSHHRKRLTAKGNAAKQQPPPSPSSPAAPSTPKKKKLPEAASSPLHAFLSPVKPKPAQQAQPAVTRRRRSCDAPRSPTIAQEHRRRASCDSPRPSPPAIVARLMGLEESAPPSPAAPQVVLPTRPPPPPPQPETAAEKRRKLLGALEKCDEDLKTLRRIIAAVRAAEMRAAAASEAVVAPAVAAAATTTPPGTNKGSANKWAFGGRDEQSPSPSPSSQQHKPGAGEQYPSPDSVLDNAIVSSPRFPCRKRSSPCSSADHDAKPGNGAVVPSGAAGTATRVVKPSRTFVFSGDYCKMKPGGDELQQQRTVVGIEASRTLLLPRLPRAAGAENWRHHRRRWELEAAEAGRVISRATAESAGEAMWGQQQGAGERRRECGMVAAALERAILHDLVCDVVAELLPLPQSGVIHGAGCRKRLCF